ncbi:amino acid adenylation domain-containing protein [Sulfitobacter albidus]|uniref:Amino acid adenylation domain-containing protein n=1 Tax=Sulfitobacter albidus TaxID=2829501 RepID=A0A975PMJ5_9RHOB|nr:non-ribosomal peptide synthetase [Sulfitobacter albidus]QUJ76789.1 amino acid adenylation domain-containing protein [Sulfitobacter albidus]
MTPQALLNRLDTLGATVTTDGTSLNVKAAKGVITQDLLGQIKAQKQALIAALSRPTARIFPQSFNQAQLWFLHRLDPGSAMYNNPMALRLDGPLDHEALGAAFDALLRRHAILRTTFLDHAGEPAQKVFDGPICALSVRVVEDPADCNTLIERHATRAFDLENDAGVRLDLLQLGPQEHVLLLNVHHICADGWSVGILLNELLEGYTARSAGRAPDLAPLAVQYADFALMQRRRFGPQEMKRKTDYWADHLRGIPHLLNLPTDRPRPAAQSHAGAHLHKHLGAALSAEINALARTTGATGFAVFLAVHAIVMGRLSGQEDICIGTSLAGRDDITLEPLIGHFINTVALRITLDANPTFADLVRAVQQTVLGAMEHQDLPFDRVVEAINPVRSAGHAPLFQTMLIYQNTPKAKARDMGALRLTPVDTDSATAKYDLTVEVFETDGGFTLGAEYCTDLFEAESVADWLDQFGVVLRAATAAPDTPINGLPFDVPGPLVGSAHALDPDLTLDGWFDRTARLSPARGAVRDETRSLSYADLGARASALAGVLAARGCVTGATVALMLDPDLDYVVAMLAVLKTGCAFVPVDPRTPQARLRHVLSDAGVALVFAREPDTDALRATGFTGPILAPDAPTGGQRIEVSADHGGNDIAAVIYTSGSTGTPKGNRVRHASLVNLIDWTQRQFSIDGNVVQKSAIGFDASLWEFLWPLLGGHGLRIVQGAARADPSLLGAHLQDTPVAVVQFVPATLRLFLDGLTDAGPPGLSHIFCGGGELTRELAEDLRRKLPGVTLVNVYGVSECAVDSVFHVQGPQDAFGDVIPIGRPIANTTILLLDEKGRPVPRGAVGEICIGGAGVGAGYINHPSAAFTETLAGLPGPWFCSGDLARLNASGRLEFVGRRDFQIKLNGFRIEPGDVESSLMRVGCSGALVTVWEDTLVAYVTGHGDPAAIKPALADLLPGYMIPAIICPLDAFPLNASGKVNRAALPPPTSATPSNAVNQSTPRDATEMTLYNIWQSVLLHPGIGIRDNFFDIGGSSIAAIKLLHKLRETTGRQLTLRDVISNPTIEALAALLRDGTDATGGEDALIRFRRGAGEVNVVCVHPAGGTAFCYLSLARALASEIGVYGLQSPGLNPGEALSPTVETMAAHYLTEIADLLDAPLVITGLSFGGLVAHEMGRVLCDGGKRDVSVVLLDTQGTDDVTLRQRIDVVDMTEFREKLVRFNGTYPGISDAQIERYFTVYNHNRLSVRDYDVPLSAARTVFIQALSDLPRSFLHEVRRYWRGRTTGDLTARLVRGDHWDMLETQELRIVTRLITRETDRLTGAPEKGS